MLSRSGRRSFARPREPAVREVAAGGSQDETIKRLATAVEARDEGTAAHIERVSLVARTLALALGVGDTKAELIPPRPASSTTNGKIGLPDGILLKPGSTTEEERREVERHPEIEGWRILRAAA